MNKESSIINGARVALIDHDIDDAVETNPSFVYNDENSGVNVLHSIKSELRQVEGFWISVAFVTKGGIQYLKNILVELENRGVKGKILTTSFLQFNHPDAMRELLKFDNIEVRVSEENLHTKGYMFDKKDGVKVLFVGSSNLTMNALKKNIEWNVKINSLSNGMLIRDVEKEFNRIWEASETLSLSWIESYQRFFESRKKELLKENVIDLETYKLVPNKMQAQALSALRNLRESGKSKALLISATGTGKTYLSAFDAREYGAKKILFIAHREQILKQSRESYSKVISKDMSSCILSGNLNDKSISIESGMVFSTIQTMSKDDILSMFSKDHFDYIVIDETHRAASGTYKKVIDYFEPQFLLGMTATPERTDTKSIFELYDYNIAYEIRLKDAMKNNLLCPFVYFGISDIKVDGQLIDDESDFRNLVSDERIRHIIDRTKFYGYSGKRLKGLIFCSRVDEAQEISNKLNREGFKTVSLSGKDNEVYREECIERLESDTRADYLDYIITVDIFNEGVDIPSINQVVMLRPTQSSIIFIQQLGRGLRKFGDKEFVTIIDFIGNYKNNYMIPIALSGDKRGKKYELRKFLGELDTIIPGLCSVDFDKITREKIYASIDNAKLNSKKEYVESYNRLKLMLGRVPEIADFGQYGSIDPLKLFSVTSPIKYKTNKNDSKGARTYHRALKVLDEDYAIEFDEIQELCMELICQKIINGKRIHELVILKNILIDPDRFMDLSREELDRKYNTKLDSFRFASCMKVLSGDFEKTKELKEKFGQARLVEKKVKNNVLPFKAVGNSSNYINSKGKTYGNELISDTSDGYSIGLYDDVRVSDVFLRCLEDKVYKDEVKKLVDYGIGNYERYYSNRYRDTDFCLNQTYTYEDVCRLLNWENSIVDLNIGGYKYDDYTNTFPVFINYIKSETISDTIKYEDKFINRNTLKAISKSKRTLESSDVKTIYSQKDNGVKIYLFVRKNADTKESKEFYFLGEMNSIDKPEPFEMFDNNKKPVSAVRFTYRLKDSVKEDLYEYITSAD